MSQMAVPLVDKLVLGLWLKIRPQNSDLINGCVRRCMFACLYACSHMCACGLVRACAHARVCVHNCKNNGDMAALKCFRDNSSDGCPIICYHIKSEEQGPPCVWSITVSASFVPGVINAGWRKGGWVREWNSLVRAVSVTVLPDCGIAGLLEFRFRLPFRFEFVRGSKFRNQMLNSSHIWYFNFELDSRISISV